MAVHKLRHTHKIRYAIKYILNLIMIQEIHLHGSQTIAIASPLFRRRQNSAHNMHDKFDHTRVQIHTQSCKTYLYWTKYNILQRDQHLYIIQKFPATKAPSNTYQKVIAKRKQKELTGY